MIGLDANVLVRYATQDDPKRAATAEWLVEGLTPAAPGFVSMIALVESVWVLRRLCEADAASISNFVSLLLDARELVVENSDVVRQALAVTHGREEFTDALIALCGSAAGCEYTVTFDRRAVAVAGMRLA